MKLFLSVLMSFVASVCLGALPPGVTGKMIHEYPNNPNPSFNLMILEDPGNGAYNQSTIGQIAAVISASGIISNGTVIMSNISVTYITNFLEFSTNLFVTTNNTFTSFVTNLFVDNSITTNAYITNLTVENITNNLFVNTNVAIINNITNNTFFTTNVTINQPGGATNLNLVPLSLMYSDVNDAESSLPNAVGVLTNNGSGAIGFSLSLSLDELDILNGYITNFFTGLTNYGVLGTDGNGLLTVGSSTITNISITNAYIQNLTNSVFVNTNVFISASNSYFNSSYVTNLYAQTNFSTNLYFVSGKGNTLVITNVSVEGVQTNKNIAASSAVITKSDQVLTNAVNAHGVFTNTAAGPPSFGLLQNAEMANSSLTIAGTGNQVGVSGGGPVSLGGTATLSIPSVFIAPGTLAAVTSMTNQSFAAVGVVTNDDKGKLLTTPTLPNTLLQNSSITIQGSAVSLGGSTLAAGSSPAFNGINFTNLGYGLPTNNLGGGAFVFGGPGTAATLYDTNITANTTLKLFDITACGATAGGIKLYVTCSGGTDRTLTFPSGCSGAGYGTPPVLTITNAKAAWFDVIYKPGSTPVTNVFWSPVF